MNRRLAYGVQPLWAESVRNALRALPLLVLIVIALMVVAVLSGCGMAQRPSEQDGGSITGNVQTMLDINDENEKAAVSAAMEKVRALGRAPRIIATSPAAVDICDKLELDLVGVCESSLYETPERYKDVQKIGAPMSPDMELVGSLSPDWILSPNSLESDLKPKYEAINADYAFMNLKSVQGMYSSILELGDIFDRQEQAKALTKEFTDFYKQFQQQNAEKRRPRVMVLMGLPGSYVIATENSYVGSLVELAGGQNVYAGETEDFLTVNTEDMKSKEPDVILRAAHALPDQVVEMFDKDFRENDIWKHFSAVQQGRVYDLPYDTFGMSATFDYPKALEQLQPMLYDEAGASDASTDVSSSSKGHV